MIIELLTLESQDFTTANTSILNLCENEIKFELDDLENILNFHDKVLVETFLSNYKLFDAKDFDYIENFINLNIKHPNKTFVSDLIYFATDFNLNIAYKKILELTIIEEEDKDLVVLACLNYIHDNIKLSFIDELHENLNYIRNTIMYYQNEQLLASLILYNITHKDEYLEFIKELTNYSDDNKEFLLNILKLKSYDQKYFNITDLKKKLKIIS